MKRRSFTARATFGPIDQIDGSTCDVVGQTDLASGVTNPDLKSDSTPEAAPEAAPEVESRGLEIWARS